MAVRTNFELFDFLSGSLSGYDLSITASDKDGVTQTVTSTDNTKRYFLHKYGTRIYPVLTGMNSATPDMARANFVEDFRAWVSNRQHNIDLQYQALNDYEYSPIENVFRHEVETIDATDETTYGRKDTESGTDSVTYGKKDTESGTDSITYGKKDTESGTDSITYGKKDTESGTDTLTKGGSEVHEIEKAGFNSPQSYTNDTKDTLTFTNRTEGTQYGHVNTESGTDSTQYGHVNTQSGTDSTQYGHVNTQSGTDSTQYGHVNTQSGTDSTDKDSTRTLDVNANVGVSTAQSLIDEELKLRLISLADMLLDNFIDDYTYYS